MLDARPPRCTAWQRCCTAHALQVPARSRTRPRATSACGRPTGWARVPPGRADRRRHALCRATKPQQKEAASAASPKEKHKIFDEVVIHVRAGNGGRGEAVEAKKGKTVTNYKYKPGGNQPKKIFLPASAPAEGADGGHVVLVCDPGLRDLLHLHERSEWRARNGSNGSWVEGSGAPKGVRGPRKRLTPPTRVPVPPGTVVKRAGNGQLLGELLAPGQELVVAHGGRGGSGVVVPTHQTRVQNHKRARSRAEAAGAEVVEVEDVLWRDSIRGSNGQEATLQLLLRVVADCGLVGLPNAGKSSLLAALTRAKPAIAPYPFTTLMPNLGVVVASSGAPEDDFEGVARAAADDQPVLADLPGLVAGAHQGRGLGRMFLRHLRRTRVLLLVLDASSPAPADDYAALREELRLYNPEYATRPHVVALNKVDLLEDEQDHADAAAGPGTGQPGIVLPQPAAPQPHAQAAGGPESGALDGAEHGTAAAAAPWPTSVSASASAQAEQAPAAIQDDELGGERLQGPAAGQAGFFYVAAGGGSAPATGQGCSVSGRGSAARVATLATAVASRAADLAATHGADAVSVPAAIVPCSALTGAGLQQLQACVRSALHGDEEGEEDEDEVEMANDDDLDDHDRYLLSLSEDELLKLIGEWSDPDEQEEVS